MTTKWLQQVMPKSVYNHLKGMIVFRPEDPINLWQATPQMQTGSKVERIKGYRYPAPGSVHRAAVPVRDSEDTVYDIKNYSRNPDNLALDVSEMSLCGCCFFYVYLGTYSNHFPRYCFSYLIS